MRLATVATIIAIVALVAAIAALGKLYDLMRHELVCTYYTYINASCRYGKCWFDIPAEPNVWYKVIEIKCSGEGVVALYTILDEWTSLKIVGTNGVYLEITGNKTAVLPIAREQVTYTVYVMTTAPLGRTSGTLLIAEIS